jgi:hypothetical protein
MGKIFTEYKSSKYDEYLKARTPQNGLSLNVYSNRVDINCESQSVSINTDPYNDYVYKDYQTYDSDSDFDFIINLNDLMVYIFKDIVSDNKNYAKIYIDRQKHKADYDKINFRFLDDELIKLVYYKEEPDIVPDLINFLFGSSIKFDLGVGIFDFIYADFDTPLKHVIDTFESFLFDDIFMFENHFVFNEKQKKYELLLDYDKTIAMISPLMYASVYTGICPPRFDFTEDVIEQMKWYGNYLITLQNEYLEMIKFCYDEDYYPELFLGASPKARYYLYREIKGLPNKIYTTIEMSSNFCCGDDDIKILDDTYRYQDFDLNKYRIEDFDFAKDSEVDLIGMVSMLATYRNIAENYVFSKVDEILELEFCKMINSNIKIKKCKRCGKYFRLKGNYNTDYCGYIAEGETRNCREIAAAEKYKEKNADNKALQIYNKYYKRYHARLKVKQIKEPDFYSWKYKTLIMRADCEDGNITPEEYEAWNEEYFPNRTKK